MSLCRFESNFFLVFNPLLSTDFSGQREEEWVLVFGWQGMGVMEGWSGGHRAWWEVGKSMVVSGEV